MALLSRVRGDELPTTEATVVLVPRGRAPDRAGVERAVAEAGSGRVAVVVLLRIHGSAWGFPNPGLLPNAREKADARQLVARTVKAIERRGGRADGQITATRNPSKVIAAAARRRQARMVLVERVEVGRTRSLIEGDMAAGVRRRLRRRRVEVEAVTVAAPTPVGTRR